MPDDSKGKEQKKGDGEASASPKGSAEDYSFSWAP